MTDKISMTDTALALYGGYQKPTKKKTSGNPAGKPGLIMKKLYSTPTRRAIFRDDYSS